MVEASSSVEGIYTLLCNMSNADNAIRQAAESQMAELRSANPR